MFHYWTEMCSHLTFLLFLLLLSLSSGLFSFTINLISDHYRSYRPLVGLCTREQPAARSIPTQLNQLTLWNCVFEKPPVAQLLRPGQHKQKNKTGFESTIQVRVPEKILRASDRTTTASRFTDISSKWVAMACNVICLVCRKLVSRICGCAWLIDGFWWPDLVHTYTACYYTSQTTIWHTMSSLLNHLRLPSQRDSLNSISALDPRYIA
jgi:hypothetical protein